MLQQFTWPQVDISPCSSMLFYYTHHSNLQLDIVSVLVPTSHINDSTLLGSALFKTHSAFVWHELYLHVLLPFYVATHGVGN